MREAAQYIRGHANVFGQLNISQLIRQIYRIRILRPTHHKDPFHSTHLDKAGPSLSRLKKIHSCVPNMDLSDLSDLPLEDTSSVVAQFENFLRSHESVDAKHDSSFVRVQDFNFNEDKGRKKVRTERSVLEAAEIERVGLNENHQCEQERPQSHFLDASTLKLNTEQGEIAVSKAEYVKSPGNVSDTHIVEAIGKCKHFSDSASLAE